MRKNYFSRLFIAGAAIVIAGSAFSSNVSSKKNAVKLNYTAAAKIELSKEDLKNIEFDFDKATIRQNSYPALNNVAKALKENNVSLKLSGHADNIGEYVYNWKLSKARAEAVKNYLVEKGADASRIAATEFGDTVPLVPNTNEDNRQKNRRVELAVK